MSFTFGGIPRGTAADMTFTRGAQSETFTTTKWGLRPFWKMSVTQEGQGNLIGAGRTVVSNAPLMQRRYFKTTQAGTDRLFVSNLNFFDGHADGFWNGGTAHVYTVTNGVRSLLTSATITATKVDLIESRTTNQMVTATSYEQRLESFNRAGVNYWLRVGPINGSGQVGTKSGWVAYTAPSSISGSTATNPTLTSITHSGTSGLAAPANVSVAAKGGDTSTAVLTWDAVSGATGYVVDLSYQDPTLNVTAEYLDIDTSGLSIPAGAIVHVEFLRTRQSDKWCTRVWNAPTQYRLTETYENFSPGARALDIDYRWVAYTGGDPAPSGIDAEHYISCPRTTSGTIFRDFFHSGSSTADEFYPTLTAGTTYRARILMRANAPISLTSTIEQVTTGGSATFNVTTSWQWFEQEFSRSSTLGGSAIGSWWLTSPGAGTVEIAARELFDTTLPVYDFSADEKPLAGAGMYLRDHTQIKPGQKTASMRQLFNRTGQISRGNTLYTLFKRCQVNDMLPWVQIEWHMPQDDWLDFLAYVCAPVASGHPMAILRNNQGQTTPWIDVFPEMILEFGNEAWQDGSIAEFWVTNNSQATFLDQGTAATLSAGATMGAHCQGIIDHMKTSPYWRKFRAKTLLYVGGLGSSATFENAVLSTTTDIDAVGTADYNGGWADGSELSGESGDSFKQVLRFRNAAGAFSSRVGTVNTAGANFAIYEAGPDYPLPGSSTAAKDISQEVVMKSRAGGTGTLGSFCIRANDGIAIDNYFRLLRDYYWSSHSSPHLGGNAFMGYALLKLVWDAVGDSSVRKLTIASVPTDGSVELLQAFEFKSAADPSNRVIVAINRDIDPSLLPPADALYNVTPAGTHACSITTGIASCSGLSYYANVGNFRQHNRYPVGFRRNSSTAALDVSDSLCVAFTYNWTTGSALGDADPIVINATYGAASGGLPAGNAVLLHLTGCVDA
jgi:hypothetical protein